MQKFLIYIRGKIDKVFGDFILGKILQSLIIKINTNNINSFNTLRKLKGKNIFDTYLNVKSFNNLQTVKKDVRSLKIKRGKIPKGISKKEKQQIQLDSKKENKELRKPFIQAIKDAEEMTRADRNAATKNIRQSIFEKQLELKQKQGKTITSFDKLKLNNPRLRDFTHFMKSKIYAAAMLNLCNYEDIKNANNQLGFGAAAEEVGKTTAMAFLGLSALKYTNTQLKNTITTMSLYCRAGRVMNWLSFPAAILFSLSAKPVMDKLWVTDYEKIK